MAPPTWLPPLNSHNNNSKITAVAAQVSSSRNRSDLKFPIFLIKIRVNVNFYSDRSSNDMIFDGLSSEKVFPVRIDSVTTAEDAIETIADTIYSMGIPFELDDVIFRERHFCSLEIRKSRQNFEGMLDEIMRFLISMSLSDHNYGHNVLPFNLTIRKTIVIPDSELEAWCSWYFAKEETDPDFAEDFAAAISRPRTQSELIAESSLAFKAATKSSIDTLDHVRTIASDSCTICLDMLQIGSLASRLPCGHVFHGGCIEKWLQESHMCPMCRFQLPSV